MSTNIRFKRSDIPGKVPSLDSIDLGELALNTADGKLFTKQEMKGPPGVAAIQKIIEIGATEVPNVLYVAKNGDDSNSGKTLGQAFLTLKKALSIATPGTTIFLKSGEYIEDNPLRVPARVSVVGDNLRNTTVRPKNPTKDIFWVYNGAYIFCMNFKGHIAPSAAVCFPPDGSAGEIVTSPYTQAVTSITTTGTGMRVDGAVTTGLRSMVCDAFTQYNQGGIGIHMLNRGNTQLVSIFTICCDISFMCENGGFCSVNLSNSSFGNYGLVSRGASEPLYRGVVKKSAGRQITFKNLAKRPNIGDGVLFADYNQKTCDRDNGLVVDSVAFDLLYEGTTQSTFSGLRYWAKDQITTGFDQQTPTAAAIQRARVAAATALAAASSTAKRIVDEEFQIISRIVSEGPVSPTLIIPPDLDAAEPEYKKLREQVLDRKAQITDEAIAFLKKNYPTVLFIESKCKRDIGFVIDAVAEDMIFGTNYKSIKAAITYLTAVADSYTIESDQRIATIEAYRFVRDKVVVLVQEDATLLSRVQNNFEIITTALKTIADGGGKDYIAAITDYQNVNYALTYPAQQDTDQVVIDLVKNLQANKNFVIAEVLDYIKKSWPQIVIYGFDATKQATCGRDIGYAIDAICYDLVYGGNSQTVDAARRYYDYASGLSQLLAAEEIPATIDAYGRAQLFAQRVVILDKIERSQTAVSQVLLGLTATNQTQVNRLGGLFSVFLKGLETEIVGTSDFIQPNGKRLNDSDLETASDLLQSNKQTIRDNVIAYLGRAFPGFDYDRVKCSRDIGYIIDSICFDLVHGGNRQAVTAGIYYFDFNEDKNVLKSVLPNQIKQTVNAYKYMKELLRDVLTCSPVPNPWQPAVPQRIDLPAATGSEVTAVGNLIDIINEILQEGPNNTEDSIQRLKQPIGLTASGDVNKQRAFDLLMANREFIRAEMIAYINQNWYTISDGDTQFARVNTATDLALGTTTTGYPTVTYQPTVYKAIRDAVLAAKEEIKEETIKFMANSFFDNFSFNKPKCYRDVGLILDAILSDMVFGSNYKTLTAAISYLRAYASEVVGAQKVQTVASLKAAKAITLARIVAPTAKEEISTRFDIIINILDGAREDPNTGITVTNYDYETLNPLSYPIPVRNSEEDLDRKTAVDILRNNVDFIKDEIVNFIDANFTLNTFDREKCARDVEFIMDALGYDLMFISNFRSISAGRAYLRANASKVKGDQKLATLGSFKYLKKLVMEIVKSNSLAVNSVQSNMDIIIDILDKGGEVVPKYRMPFPEKGRSIEYKRARDLVEKNREFIVEDVLTYINTPGLELIKGTVKFKGVTGAFLTDGQFTVNLAATQTEFTLLEVGDLVRVSGRPVVGSSINGFSSPSVYKVVAVDAPSNVVVNGVTLTYTPNFKLAALDGSSLTVNPGPNGVTTTLRFEKIVPANYDLPTGFDVEKCRRDLNLILDALYFDTTYGGTLESFVAGASYVAGTLSQLDPSGTQLDEVKATLRAYQYLKTVIQNVAQDIAWTPTVGNIVVQTRSPNGSDGSAAAALEMGTCIDLVLKLIDDAETGTALVPALVTVSSVPSTDWVDPALKKTFDVLMASKNDTKTKVTDYVDENFVLFGYDREKCRRDVGYVVEAVRFDMLLNSNFRSIVAGRSYYRAMSEVVVKDQKSATLASFTYLKELLLDLVKPADPDNPTTAESLAVSRVARSMDVILKILDNGLAAEPEILITDPSSGFTGTDLKTLRDNIQTNRDAIENELINWIDDQIANNGAYSGVTYSETACRRDVEYILDALRYDLTYETNVETRVASLAYYAGNSGIALALGSDEKALTLAAYEQLKEIIDGKTNVTITDSAVDTLLDIIITYISSDGNTLATVDVPRTDWTDPNLKLTYDKLGVEATVTKLKNKVTDFVDMNFAYNRDKCARDVGFLLDALCYDLLYGGNVDTTQAAIAYFDGAVTPKSTIPKQIIQTVAAYERLKEVLDQVVQLKDVQPSGVAFDAANKVSASIDLINKIIEDGPGFTPNKPFLMPKPTATGAHAGNVDYFNAAKMIGANRRFLIAETTSFIESNNPPSSYNKVKCERDVDLIIDAVMYDVTYGNNTASHIAADAYYGNTALGGDADELAATVAAFNFLGHTLQMVAKGTKITSQTLAGVTITGIAGQFSCTANNLMVGQRINISGITTGAGTITGYTGTSPAVNTKTYKISATNGTDTFTLVELDGTPIGTAVNTTGTTTGLTFSKTQQQSVEVQRLGVGDATGTAANKAMNLVKEVIVYKIDGLPDTSAPNRQDPIITWVDSKLTAINTLIDAAGFRQDVKNAVVTLMADKFPGLGYTTTQASTGNTLQVECEEDIDAVIDAVRFDLMFGSNYRSQLAGNAYYRNITGANNVLANQKDASIAVFNLVKDSILEKVQSVTIEQVLTGQRGNQGAAEFARDRIQNVINFIAGDSTNDPQEIEALTTWVDPDLVASSTLMDSNAATTKAAVTTYINDRFPELIYNVADCQEDIVSIIDAVRFDMMFNSNFRTITAARAYFRAQASKVVGEQRVPTIEAFKFLKEKLVDQVKNTALAAERVADRMDLLVNIVTVGESAIPTYVLPSPTGYNTTYLASYGYARNLIETNREFLKSEVLKFILNDAAFITLDFKEDKCLRDLDYLLDALYYDMTYGGNMESVIAGGAYYLGRTSIDISSPQTAAISGDDVAATIAAFEKLRDLVLKVAQGFDVTDMRTLVDQSPGTPGSTAGAQTGQNLAFVIRNLVNQGGSFGVAAPAFVEPNYSWVPNDLKDPNDLIVLYQTSDPAVVGNPYPGRFSVQSQMTEWLRLQLKYARINDTAVSIGAEGSGPLQTPIVPFARSGTWTDWFAAVDATPANMVDGQKYVIHTVGTGMNWTSVGAGAATAGTEFTYNDATPISGTGGKVVRILTAAQTVAGKRYKIKTISGGTGFTSIAVGSITSAVDEVFIRNTATLTGVGTDEVYEMFTYNIEKCERDIGLIMDAVRYDMMFNTTFRTITAARSYWRQQANEALASGTTDLSTYPQKAVTRYMFQYLKSVLQALPATYPNSAQFNATDGVEIPEIVANSVAYNRIGTNMDYIIAALNAASEAALLALLPQKPFSLPLPAGGTNNSSDAGYRNARDLIEENREFIKAEVLAWIDQQKRENREGFATPFNFNRGKCKEDLDFILDAIYYDLTYGGNMESYTAGLAYYTGVTVNDSLGSDEKEATIRAYNYMGQIIYDIARNAMVKSVQRELSQVTGTAGSPETSQRLSQLVDIVINVVKGGVKQVPVREEPDFLAGDETLAYVRLSIQEQKRELQARIADYIDSFILQYNTEKCARDVGLILDAAMYDLVLNSNFQSVTAGSVYLQKAANVVTSTQIGPQLQAIKFIRDKVIQVSQTPPLVKNDAAIGRITNLFDTMFDIIDKGVDVAPAIVNTPPLGAAFNPNAVNAANSILANKEFLKEEVVAYITANYKTYDQSRCSRDVGLIIDAALYDLLLDTNYNSIKAGQAYRRATSSLVLTDQLKETLGGIDFAKDKVVELLDDAESIGKIIQSFELISSIISGGSEASASLPLPGGSVFALPRPAGIRTRNPKYAQAAARLRDDKATIAEGVSDWIKTQINTASNQVTGSVWFNFDYTTVEESKCEEDIGFIIDAIAYDLTYGGNLETINAGYAYYMGVSQADSLPADEVGPTIAAYGYLADQVKAVISDEVSSDEVANEGRDLVLLVRNLIDSRYNAVASTVLPNQIWVDALAQEVSNTINNNKSQYQDYIIDYVNNINTFAGIQKPENYDIEKCRRDVGLVLDAVRYDLMFGTTFRTLSAGRSYKRSFASEITDSTSQEPANIRAFKELKERVLGQKLSGVTVTTSTLTGVETTGTAGEFSFTGGTTLTTNHYVTVTGTLTAGVATGSITGYTTGTTYEVTATNGTGTFTLKNLDGTAIVTTAGTLDGLTFTSTNGTFGCTNPTTVRNNILRVDLPVRVAGVYATGSATLENFSNIATQPKTYYIIGSPSNTSFQLSETINGAPIRVTPGTLTSLAFEIRPSLDVLDEVITQGLLDTVVLDAESNATPLQPGVEYKISSQGKRVDVAGSFVVGGLYKIETTGITVFDGPAGTLGITYNIGDTFVAVDAGTGTGTARYITDYTKLGAVNNNVDTVFVATGTPSLTTGGTGTVETISIRERAERLFAIFIAILEEDNATLTALGYNVDATYDVPAKNGYVQTSTTAALNARETTITVSSTANFLTAGTLKIGDETVTYTGKGATTFTGVTRSVNAADTAIDDANGITSSDSTITVDDTTGFTNKGILVIGSEEIRYTGKTATTFVGLTRGFNGSTAASHADDAVVKQGFNHASGAVVQNSTASFYVHPNPVLETTDFDVQADYNAAVTDLTGRITARNNINQARLKLEEDLISWIEVQYTGRNGNFDSDFEAYWEANSGAKRDKCREDIRLILDAIAYDLTYGGNQETVVAGKAYYDGEALGMEKLQTIDAYTFFKTQLKAVAEVNNGDQAKAVALIDDLLSFIDPRIEDPMSVNPDTSWVDSELYVFSDKLKAEADSVAKATTDYINANFPVLVGFYNVATCQRDVKLIIEAVRWDMMFNSNFRTIVAARSYYRSQVVTGNFTTGSAGSQKPATIAAFGVVKVALDEIVKSDTVAQSRVAALMDIVLAILNDVANIPAISTPYGATPNAVDIGYLNATLLLEANRDYLIEEVYRFVQENSPPAGYDVDKCKRDTSLILDAVKYDLTYGGSLETKVAAKAYYEEVVAADSLPDAQLAATKNAFNRLANTIELVLKTEDAPESTGNNLTQVTNLDPASADAAAQAKDLVNIVTRALTRYTIGTDNLTLGTKYIIVDLGTTTNANWNTLAGTTTVTPTITYALYDTFTAAVTGSAITGTSGKVIEVVDEVRPSTSWVDNNLALFASTMLDRKESLGLQVTDYIDANFQGLTYTKETCQRDVGLVVDAVRYDMMFGLVFRSWTAGRSYLRSQVTSGNFSSRQQQDATLASFRFLKGLLLAITGNNVTASNRVRAAMNVVIDTLEYGVAEGPAADSTLMLYGTDTYARNAYNDMYADAAEAIATNKDLLLSQMTTWLDSQGYAGSVTSYNLNKCLRDIGYLIDAIRYDLTYGGNMEIFNAGRAYYSGAVLANDNPGHIAATKASFLELKAKIKALSGVSGSVESVLDAMIDTVNRLIDDSDATNVAEVPADVSWAEVALQEVSVAMRLQTNTIKTQVADWVDTNFPGLMTSAQKDKCARDTGILLDAVRYDMLLNSNFRSLVAGRAYYRDAVNLQADGLATQGQKTASIAAFNYLKDILQGIAAVNPTAYERVTANMDIILELLENGEKDYADPSSQIDWPSATTANSEKAAKALLNNKNWIAKEVSAYINATYNEYEYKEDRCARDVEFITTAVAYDLVVGGNFQTVRAAQGYLRANASEVYDAEQKHITLLAFKYLKNLLINYVGGDATAVTRVKNSLDIIIRVVYGATYDGSVVTPAASGENAVPALVYGAATSTNWTATALAGDYTNASVIKTIIDDVITWIGNNNPPSGYTEAKCKRDLQFILEGLRYDLTHGGNWATVINARSYYVGTANQLGPDSDEIAATIAAYNYLKTLNLLTNAISGTVNGVDADDRAATLIQIIISVIQNGLSALPAIEYPEFLGANDDLEAAKNILLSNVANAQAKTIRWINNRAYFTYDVQKCERDLGYILEAVYGDVATDSNFLSYTAGAAYLRNLASNNVALAPAQKYAHLAGLAYAKIVLADLVSSNTQAGARIRAKLDVVIDLINDNVDSTDPDVTNVTIDYASANSTRSAADKADINKLQDNRAKIQDIAEEVLDDSFDALYSALSPTQLAACKRDVGLIVDALTHDLYHGGNAAVRQAAISYVVGTAVQLGTTTEDEKAGMLGVLDALKTLFDGGTAAIGGISAGNTLVALTANADLADDFDDLVDVIREVISDESLANLDALDLPNGYGTFATAATTLNSNHYNNTWKVFENINSRPYLDYSGATLTSCEDDVADIVTALSLDVASNSNYKSVVAGLAYLRSYTKVVTQEQKAATIGALYFIKRKVSEALSGDATAKARARDRMNTIIDIVNRGVSAAPALAITSNANTDVIEDNYAFIKAEVRAFIDREYPELDYDKAKCERDVQYILDALRYDIAYGGNTASTEAALAYWEGGVLTLGSHPDGIDDPDVTGGESERAATLAAYARLKLVVQALLEDDDTYVRLQTVESRVAGSGLTSPYFDAEPLVDRIINIIDSDSFDTEDSTAVSAATIGLVQPASITANATIVALQSSSPSLAENTSSEILLTFNSQFFVYNREKCERDVKFIVEALAFDTYYGGNKESREVALQYLYKGGLVIPVATKAPTVGGYAHLESILDDVISGNTPSNVGDNALSYNDDVITTDTATINAVVAKAGYVRKALKGQALPALVEPNAIANKTVDPELLITRAVVRDSIPSIAAQTITFINETYAGFGYLQDTCKRDVGLTLDAVAYDLIYGGNSRTKFAAEQYYSGGRFQIPADSKSATVACFVYLGALAAKVVKNDPIVTFQNYVDQDKSNLAATQSEVTNIASLFDAYTDILTNGYISVVQLDATFNGSVDDNTFATFHQVSTITTTGHTLEWVGTGIDVDSALPYNGGVPKPENQLVSEKGGFINFTSTDEKGDFRIGPDLTIKRDSGSIVGRAFNKSLLGVVTPYILALQS